MTFFFNVTDTGKFFCFWRYTFSEWQYRFMVGNWTIHQLLLYNITLACLVCRYMQCWRVVNGRCFGTERGQSGIDVCYCSFSYTFWRVDHQPFREHVFILVVHVSHRVTCCNIKPGGLIIVHSGTNGHGEVILPALATTRKFARLFSLHYVNFLNMSDHHPFEQAHYFQILEP